MSTPAQPDDLLAFLHQQFENQRFRGQSLKTLAFALPPETGAYLTETGELLLAEVDAKRRILDLHADPHECPEWDRLIGETSTGYYSADECPTLRLSALPFAGRPGYREEWRPA